MNVPSIELLMLAVVQDQDRDEAITALEKLNLPVVYLGSTGGYLGRRNTTLLIELRESQDSKALQALKETCHQRIEYLSMPLEGTLQHLSMPVPVTVGGAAVFALPVEQFEEI